MKKMEKDTDVSDMSDGCNKEEDNNTYKMQLDESNFQISLLEGQLEGAYAEIKFLREELSSTQLSLLSSRSEVSTLLEELTTYRSGKEWKEEFPDLLLSSLDKLYQDKQQQLYLISGIHNNIEKTKQRNINDCEEEINSNYDSVDGKVCDNDADIFEEKAPKSRVPTISEENGNSSRRMNVSSLKLELRKSYEFTPASPSWSNRPSTAPSTSIFAPRYQSWTPTTPTPCSALRPSLSLHNLESKTFTEVLIPSIKPPVHQVSPPLSAGKRSPRTISSSPSKLSIVQFGEKKSYKSGRTDENINKGNESSHLFRNTTFGENLQPCISLPSLTNKAETFVEYKKEISV